MKNNITNQKNIKFIIILLLSNIAIWILSFNSFSNPEEPNIRQSNYLREKYVHIKIKGQLRTQATPLTPIHIYIGVSGVA